MDAGCAAGKRIRMSGRMNIAETVGELHSLLAISRGRNRIALVPTMGCLHAGHVSLIRKAREIADIVVLSIYVNPLQFGPNEDFDAYPRTFEEDCAICDMEGVDAIFHPQNLYPNGQPQVRLQFGNSAGDGLADCLCGAERPGHFDGMAMAVAILLNIVQPDVAIFGEKDWQQLAIVRRMVGDLQMPVELIGVQTMREADGLAMSSRNRYLSVTDRQKAVLLSQVLNSMRKAAESEQDTEILIQHARNILAGAGLQPEYLEIRDADNLTPVRNLGGRAARAFIACRIGPARLIDNIFIANTTKFIANTTNEEALNK
ncbi:MAG: pantoate--beta-alanine ligase [Mariprofundaceae bacterium]